MRGIAFGLGMLTVVLAACSHGLVEKRLDDKLRTEPTPSGRAALQTELGEAIRTAPGLTSDQRERLVRLRNEAREQASGLRNRSIRLKSVLVQDLLSPDYDPAEVRLLESRIQENNQKRVTLLMATLRQANVILGRWPSRSEREYEDAEFYNDQMFREMAGL